MMTGADRMRLDASVCSRTAACTVVVCWGCLLATLIQSNMPHDERCMHRGMRPKWVASSPGSAHIGV